MRRIETSTLAFLDVMACGLGAVILILVVLKQQAPANTAPQPQDIVRASRSEAELDKLQKELATQLTRMDKTQTDVDQQQKITANIVAKITKTSQDLAAANKLGVYLNQSINNIKNELAMRQTTPPDPIDTSRIGQPQYIVGLPVTGNKIAILLDRSASMTARELVDILRYKAGPKDDRRSASKWKNALNAVWWMAARAPAKSQLRIASFSDTTTFHSDNWISATDSTALAAVKADMAQITPAASTNLEAAVVAMIKTGADSLYIITDGLPTAAPGGQSLLGLDGCGSKLSKRNQVTGKCRISLLRRTVAAVANKQVRISVILMPLEGDPDAAPLYSKWALSKGGVLLSAAKDWP